MTRKILGSYLYIGVLIPIILNVAITYSSEPKHSGSSVVQLLLNTNERIATHIRHDIDAVPKGGYVGIENPYLTDQSVIKALVDAAQREVMVVANLGRGTKLDVIQQLKKAGVHVYLQADIHAKRCLYAHEDPTQIEDSSSATVGIYVGSYNFSNISWGHQEDVIKDNNVSMFKEQFADHQAITDKKYEDKEGVVKSPIKKTPTKPAVFNSRVKDLHAAKALRISHLLDNLQEEDVLDITSMTFDTHDIMNALKNVAQRADAKKISPKIRLILDASALKHRDLLDTMHTAGVKIFIYNHDHSQKIWDKYPKLQHSKLLARYQHSAKKHLVVVSTGNCAHRSNQEVNLDTYYPCDEQLFTQVHAFCDELQKLCTPYCEVPKPEPVRKKRKLNNDES